MSKGRIIAYVAGTVLLLAVLVLGVRHYREHRWLTPGPGDRIFVPVFVLHRIMPGEPGEYSMTPDNLERLLTELNNRNFTPITLAQLDKAIRKKGPLPNRPAMITFDDAYLDNYENAAPILKKTGWKGVFFAPVEKISDLPDRRVAWGDGPNPLGMTWQELTQLKENGMDIGSHGMDHVNLRKVDDYTLTQELAQSRHILEQRLGIPVRALAYPGGRENDHVLEFAKQAGYTMAFLSGGGVIPWPPEDPLLLPRVHVPGYLDPKDIVKGLPICIWAKR